MGLVGEAVSASHSPNSCPRSPPPSSSSSSSTTEAFEHGVRLRGGQCSRGTSAPLFHSLNHQSVPPSPLPSYTSLFLCIACVRSVRTYIRTCAHTRAAPSVHPLTSVLHKTAGTAIRIKRPIHERERFISFTARDLLMVMGVGSRAAVTGRRIGSRACRRGSWRPRGDYLPPFSVGAVINVGAARDYPRDQSIGYGSQYVRGARR